MVDVDVKGGMFKLFLNVDVKFLDFEEMFVRIGVGEISFLF